MSVSRTLPLTSAQEWVLRYQRPTERFPILVDIGPDRKLEEVAEALDRLTAAHEALRARLVEGGREQPSQVIEPAGGVRIELQEVTVSGGLPALERACVRFAESPLDPTRTVARALVVTGAATRWLCLVVDHFACDAWGINVLVTDLRELLTDGLMRQAPRPQLSDLVLGRSRDREEENQRYWRERLVGLPAATTYGGGEVDRHAPGQSLAFALPAGTMEQVRRLASARSVSPFTVVLSALTALAGGYSGQFRMVISNNFLNRVTRREMLAAANVFQRHYLPIDADGAETVSERVDLVHEVCLASYRRSAFSSCALHDWLLDDAERRGAWFRPALVVNHLLGSGRPDERQETPFPYAPATGTVQPLAPYWIDLASHTRWTRRGCIVELRIGRPLLDARGIELIERDFLTVLDAMLDDPGAAVVSLPAPRLPSTRGMVLDARTGVCVDPGLVERLIVALPDVGSCRVSTVDDSAGTSLRATVRLDAARRGPAGPAVERELRRALHATLEHTRGAVVPRDLTVVEPGDVLD